MSMVMSESNRARLEELKQRRKTLAVALTKFAVEMDPQALESVGGLVRARRELKAVQREMAILRSAGR